MPVPRGKKYLFVVPILERELSSESAPHECRHTLVDVNDGVWGKVEPLQIALCLKLNGSGSL